MTTKHTPGPWNADGARIDDSSGFHVGWANEYASSFGNGVHRANARLIAAAPELLEALENIWDFLAEDDGEGACSPLYQSAIDKVKAAIAKAKGEAP